MPVCLRLNGSACTLQVLTDCVIYPTVDRARATTLLRQHLFEHVVCLGGKFYVQKQGIPQGSVLSTLLCNMYYAEMEREHHLCDGDDGHGGAALHGSSSASAAAVAGGAAGAGAGAVEGTRPADAAARVQSILLRLTDDFLFISTSLSAATTFCRRIHAGFADYNCFVNPLKSLVNFDVRVVTRGGEEVAVPRTATDFVPWCGLLFDTRTCELFANFTRCVLRCGGGGSGGSGV
jgi:telomerase reverse transcriptase